MFNRKVQRIITIVLAILLILAMVIPMLAYMVK